MEIENKNDIIKGKSSSVIIRCKLCDWEIKLKGTNDKEFNKCITNIKNVHLEYNTECDEKHLELKILNKYDEGMYNKMLEYIDKSHEYFERFKDGYNTLIECEVQVNKIKKFHKHRKSLLKDKLPYKLGFICYGVPGTGKTESLKCMIKEELSPKNDIVIFLKAKDVISGELGKSSSNVKNIIDMCKLMRNTYNKSVHVIADEGEKKFSGRESTSQNLSILATTWLEETGGMEETDRIHLYITTNKIEMFDRAFIRPGRVSELIEYYPLSINGIKEMYRKNLIPILNDDERKGININSLSDIVIGLDYAGALIKETCDKTLKALKIEGVFLTQEIIRNELLNEKNKFDDISNYKDIVNKDVELLKSIISYMKNNNELVGNSEYILTKLSGLNGKFNSKSVGWSLQRIKNVLYTNGILFDELTDGKRTKKFTRLNEGYLNSNTQM